MFGNRKKTEHHLDSVIERATAYLEMTEPGTDEYRSIVNELERLSAIRTAEMPKPERVSRDTLAIVLGNLAGVLIIIAYEQNHVWTSKATLIRPRHQNIG